MTPTRREFLAAAAAVPALGAAQTDESPKSSGTLGLVIHSFPVHTAGDRSLPPAERFGEPANFIEHARKLGVGAVQVGLGVRPAAGCDALREKAAAASVRLEGIVSLPRKQSDVDRFEAEILTAAGCGATVVRGVLLSGRRYETFTTAAAFRAFAGASAEAVRLAAAVVAPRQVLLAVENHKDFRADELLALLKKNGNDQVGVCLDTGNSISLLEDPYEVVETLAARTFTTHFKDMGVQETPDGFLLAEVPLGSGMLDLSRLVKTVAAVRPGVRFNLEMITRDPLSVPCLTEPYWSTFPDLPGRHLVRTLATVRRHKPAAPLPRVSHLPRAEQLRAEDGNVRACLEYARTRLGLS